MTTPEEIWGWLQDGKRKGATHMIVACDTFNYEDYPVYVMPGQSVQDLARQYTNPDQMSRVMEVYSYAIDLEQQLAEHRAYHFD